MVTLDDQLHLQSYLDSIKETLNVLASQPANPQHQGNLASNLDSLSKSCEKLRAAITPSQTSAITEMGGAEFFDSTIADKIKSSVSANAMTPTVVRDFVQDIASRRSNFLQNVRGTICACPLG